MKIDGGERWGVGSESLSDGMPIGGVLMELTSAISGLQQARTTSAIQMKVARKVLDVQEFQGQAAVQLIEAASRTTAKAGDALVAAATGLGGNLDVAA
jgi:hypothetical protein